jgi:hypothetical protein
MMFYISFFLEVLALLIGLVLWRRLKPPALRLIIVLLFITVVNEGLTFYEVFRRFGINKHIFYNCFFLLEIILFCLLFIRVYKKGRHRQVVKLTMVLALILCSIFTGIFGFTFFNRYFLIVVGGSLIFLGLIHYHFIYVSTVIMSIFRDPIFWLSSGLIMVNFIYLLFVAATFIPSFRSDLASREVFQSLNSLANVFYYGCIITAFICSSKFPMRVGT